MLQLHHIFNRSVMPLDLAQCNRIIGCATGMFHGLIFEPGLQFATDIARTVIRQHARLVGYHDSDNPVAFSASSSVSVTSATANVVVRLQLMI